MKKILTATLVLVLVAAGAFATNMRTLTMGENNNILIDDNNIWLYPSRIVNYPNLAIAEVRFSSDPAQISQNEYNDPYFTNSDRVARFGVHWKFGEKNPWVLGTYFYNDDQTTPWGVDGMEIMPFRTYMFGDVFNNWINYPSSETYNEGDQRLSLFIGHVFGEYNIGFKATAMHSSRKHEFTDTGDGVDKDVQSLGTYEFALGLTNKSGSLDLAADLWLLTFTNKNIDGNDNWKPDGNMAFSLKGRYFHKVNPTVTLVPNAGFLIAKAAAKNYGGGTTVVNSDKFNLTSFYFGSGMHYTPVQKVLAVLDFGVAITNGKRTETPAGGTATVNKDDYLTLPYFRMGMEADVFNWLDVRLGSSSYWQRETYKNETANNGQGKFNYPDNKTYLGLGFNFNRLHVDTYTDPNLFLHGFNFISGDTPNNHIDMNFGLSVLYEMF